MSKRKNCDPERCCETCGNLIPVGEGDCVCHEFNRPIFPIKEYMQTEDYYRCSGEAWVE